MAGKWGPIVAVLTGIVVTACASSGRSFEVTLPPGFYHPLPVTLIDHTGLVTGISEAAVNSGPAFRPVLHHDPVDPNSAILTWPGGACDSDATVTLQHDDSYLITLRTRESAGSGCILVAVPRSIRISTSAPLPIDDVSVTGG
jgi:hypothetical protein